MSDTRVRISLAAGEFEVEGSEAFVRKYDSVVDELLEKLRDVPSPKAAVNNIQDGAMPGSHDEESFSYTSAAADSPDFGEVLQQLPSKATNTDQILLAGHFVQRRNTDNSFATNEANSLLLEQGVKLSNASQSLKNNLDGKRVFKLPGKRWRVSRAGEEHLSSLTNS